MACWGLGRVCWGIDCQAGHGEADEEFDSQLGWAELVGTIH